MPFVQEVPCRAAPPLSLPIQRGDPRVVVLLSCHLPPSIVGLDHFQDNNARNGIIQRDTSEMWRILLPYILRFLPGGDGESAGFRLSSRGRGFKALSYRANARDPAVEQPKSRTEIPRSLRSLGMTNKGNPKSRTGPSVAALARDDKYKSSAHSGRQAKATSSALLPCGMLRSGRRSG